MIAVDFSRRYLTSGGEAATIRARKRSCLNSELIALPKACPRLGYCAETRNTSHAHRPACAAFVSFTLAR